LTLRRRRWRSRKASGELDGAVPDFGIRPDLTGRSQVNDATLDADLLGTPQHLEMRQTASKAVMDEFKTWLDAEQGRHLPKGPMRSTTPSASGPRSRSS